jgi:hypothetical protein
MVGDLREAAVCRSVLGAVHLFAAEMLDAGRRAVSRDFAGAVGDASLLRQTMTRRDLAAVRTNRNSLALGPVEVGGGEILGGMLAGGEKAVEKRQTGTSIVLRLDSSSNDTLFLCHNMFNLSVHCAFQHV